MHHPIFEKFPCWEGEVEAGLSANFLGVLTRDRFFTMMEKNPCRRHVKTSLPAFDEEYFEWIDVLESIALAHNDFTMIELGAGYGRWMVHATAALRSTTGIPYRLIGVEPEPTHFKWIKTHFKDNNIVARKHQLIKAAAADHDGWTWFYIGRPDEWYGQAIAPNIKAGALREVKAWFTKRKYIGNEQVKKVKSISLNTLLRPLERVDLIDLDVQGAELAVLEAASKQLGGKVKRVHIGTHGQDIERGLRALFQGLGWEKLNDYACNSECETPYGRIKFGDGVQTWVNPEIGRAALRR